MGLSLRQALYASIASSSLALSSAAYGDTDMNDILINQDNTPETTLVEVTPENQLETLAQNIFDTQENFSQRTERLRGLEIMGDYGNQTFPVLIAALKLADEGVTDPETITRLAQELILAQDVPRLANGAPTPEYAPYYTQDIYNQALLIDITIYRAMQVHPDLHTQEELALIALSTILDRASNGVSDPETLVAYALNAALQSMDPHSRFVPETQVQELLDDTTGSFSGIGAQVSTDRSEAEMQARQDAIDEFFDPYLDEDGYIRSDLSENEIIQLNEEYMQRFPELTIIEGFIIEGLINEETPAALAGVQPGDMVTHIDGNPVAGMTIGDSVELIIGPRGSNVELTIRRQGEENPLTITVTRDNVVVSPVTSRMIEGNVGYIHANSFNDQTDRFVDEAIRELTAQGAQYFILDLRDNPGGLIDQADQMINNFIDGEPVTSSSPAEVIERNIIISQRTAQGKNPSSLARPGTETDLPMVVLINGSSASASEIVAGVLQDYDRATIIGTQSFGKGSGQAVIPFDFDRDGVPEAIAPITSFFFYVGRGEGHSIQGVGITPDIRLSEEFRAVAPPRRSESGLNSTLARPEDGNYNRQSEAECRPADSSTLEAVIPEDLTLRNGSIDPWIACAVAHLRGDDTVPFVSINPLEQEAAPVQDAAPALTPDTQ